MFIYEAKLQACLKDTKVFLLLNSDKMDITIFGPKHYFFSLRCSTVQLQETSVIFRQGDTEKRIPVFVTSLLDHCNVLLAKYFTEQPPADPKSSSANADRTQQEMPCLSGVSLDSLAPPKIQNQILNSVT